MFRTPLPSAGRSMLEQCNTDDLLGIFESYLRTNTRKIAYNDFPVAWGILFSELYLSAEELVSEIQEGKHQLETDKECMLREFIHMDCRTGGAFVLNVIKKGGKTDRAALIMFSDPRDLAGLVHQGTTALHLLTEACDKGIRPALIERAGKKMLSEVFDNKDLPVIFLILSQGDLSGNDLIAIEKIFTRDDLRGVRSRKGTGKSALEAFTEVSAAVRSHGPRDRNMFNKNTAVRTTNFEGSLRDQIEAQDGTGQTSGAAVRTPRANNAKSGDGDLSKVSEKYGELIPESLENITRIMQRKPGAR
jgi:hypothetical protein